MSDKKISQFTELTAPSTDDFLPVVDASSSTTKKIKLSNLPLSDLSKSKVNSNTTDFQGTTETTKLLTGIPNSGFKNNINLNSIHIGSSVTSIGVAAFYNCIGLTEIHIPSSVTEIKSKAFQECTNIVTRTFSEGLTNIGDEAFRNQQLAKGNAEGNIMKLPSTVTGIGVNSFTYNIGISGVILPEGLTSIGNAAFYYAGPFFDVTIPDSVTSMGDTVFSRCSTTSITFGTGITEIPSFTFYHTNAGKVRVSSNLTRIKSSACMYGSASFYKANSITHIEANAFYQGTLNSISSDGTVTPKHLDISDNLVSVNGFGYSTLQSAVLPSTVTSCNFYNARDLVRIDCFTTKTVADSFDWRGTANGATLVVHARASDSTWTAGTNLTIAQKAGVTVIKDL
jgi:hypothetical protein